MIIYFVLTIVTLDLARPITTAILHVPYCSPKHLYVSVSFTSASK